MRVDPATRRRGGLGFTLLELLIVLVVMGIAFGLALPTLGDSKELRLRAAARTLAADLEFAQIESIAHPDDLRVVAFDTTDQDGYWIAPASNTAEANAITDPVRQGPFVVTFGQGRGAGIWGVSIQSVSLGGDSELQFDAYGMPDQDDDATVTLACDSATLTVKIPAGSGEVVVSEP